MSIVFSAIVPHPPLIIPSIGKENLLRLKNTIEAFKTLEENLYSSGTETIFIISPHGPIQSDAFTMNLSPEFTGNLEQFGDFSTKLSFKGDIGLAYKIRESLETKAPLQMTSLRELDYASLISLSLLTKNLPDIKIIPLYYSGLDLEAHFKFGQMLKRELIYNKNRIAVIATGDLSHRLSKEAPAGYSAKGSKFDKKIIELLTKNKSAEIIKLNHKLIIDASECGLKAIIILLGILDGINNTPEKFSYEAPFGVGYLVMNFKL